MKERKKCKKQKTYVNYIDKERFYLFCFVFCLMQVFRSKNLGKQQKTKIKRLNSACRLEAAK